MLFMKFAARERKEREKREREKRERNFLHFFTKLG